MELSFNSLNLSAIVVTTNEGPNQEEGSAAGAR